MAKKYFETLNSAFIAHFARRFADLLLEQSGAHLKSIDLSTPATSVSTLLFLSSAQQAKVTEVADALGVSHQMATQRLNNLEKVGLIERIVHPNDRRSRLINLTHKGQSEANTLKNFESRVSSAIDELEIEIGCDLTAALRRAELALIRKPFEERLDNKV